jgi:hypothetical protein
MSRSWIGCFPQGAGKLDSEMNEHDSPVPAVPRLPVSCLGLECVMIIILGLIILVAAVIAGVAGVLGNDGSGHAVTHFSVFGYHVTGSTGTLFLYGIVVGAAALFGLSLLLAGARRTSRRGTAARRGLRQSRREMAAVTQDRDDLIGQRDTARAYTASALGDGTPPGGRDPGPDGSRRGRLHLFGHRPAPRQAVATHPEPSAGEPAADVPADTPAPAEQLTNGSRP